MKKYKVLLIAIITILFTYSCDTSDDGLIFYPGPYLGIKETSEDGLLLGGDKDTDWYDIPLIGFSVLGAYPNPTEDKCEIKFSTTKTRKITIYLHHYLTNYYKIIADNESMYAGSYTIRMSLKDMGVPKGFIRVYFNVDGYITYGDIFYK